MAERIFTLNTSDGSNAFELVGEGDAGDSILKIDVFALKAGQEEASATVEVVGDPAGKITITPPSFGVTGLSLCLITCALGPLVGEILMCRRELKKSGTRITSKALLSCLRTKGHVVSAGAASCAVSCIGSIASP